MIVGHHPALLVPDKTGTCALGNLMDIEAEDIPPDLDVGDIDNRRRSRTEKSDGALFIGCEVSPRRYRDGNNFRSGNRGLVSEKNPPAKEDEKQQDRERNTFLSGGICRGNNHPLT